MTYTSREVYEFISKQTGDPIVERKTCTISGQPFAIFQSDVDFYAKISPTFNGQKFQIPTPTLCPEERQRRRLSFRNERTLYRRQCDATKKSIISIYSPDKPYKVYDQKIRRSDSRDPMDYGMDFDFSKTFAENFRELMVQVPMYSIVSQTSENCDYCPGILNSKNCYLTARTSDSENILYGYRIHKGNDCIDSNQIENSSLLYESIELKDCYNCFYCSYSINCKNSIGLFNCENCDFCIHCSNLKNKKYYIHNKPSTKEEYEKIKQQQGIYIRTKGEYHFYNNNCEGTYGVSNIDSINCYGAGIKGSNTTKYALETSKCNDCYDCYSGGFGQVSCEMTGSISMTSCYSGIMVRESNNIMYSQFCFNNSSNLFGCIGLRNKSYCIFNKQYTKEAYETQVANIIAHMQNAGERGEFFHPSLSPFGYNETVAQEYFPLPNNLVIARNEMQGSDEAIQGTENNQNIDRHARTSLAMTIDYSGFGYQRSTYNADPSIPEGIQTIEYKNYSDEQWDNLLSQDNLETQVFLCSVAGRPYRLQKTEIAFYRKHHLPIPDKHPDVRHEERMKLRPGRTLFLRNCDCCNKEMLSVYSQGHEGKVYCEECYQKEVYS